MTDETDNAVDAPVAEHVVEHEEAVDSWKEAAGIAGNANFDKFQTPADLAKSYGEMSKMVGRSVRIPTEEASAEDMSAFVDKLKQVPGVIKMPGEDDKAGWDSLYAAIGKPSDVNGYNLNEVEGSPIDAESVGALKAAFHEANLTNDQAEKVYGYLAGNLTEEATAAKETGEKAMAELKGEWGQAFQSKIDGAVNAAKILEERVPGITDFFEIQAEKGYDASFVRLMDAVNEMLGEGKPITSSSRSEITPDEARERISDIRNNPNHPAIDPMAQGHQEARERLMDLYKAASGA